MANRVYSNSFFHYTSSLDAVKMILEEGFKVFFCREEVYSLEKEVVHLGVPMVSFCDLPLSFLAQINYGKLGIGMSRPWGIRRLLIPVSYYPNNKECFSTKTIIQATQAFLDNKSASEYSVLGYSKPLYKIVPDPGKNRNNYIEREWRKVFYSAGAYKWKTEKEYSLYRGTKDSPKKPVGDPIPFNVDDVDFIIIPETNKVELIDFLMHSIAHVGGNSATITNSERETLVSKIVTFEQLKRNI